MSRVNHYRVNGRLEMASRSSDATVSIERDRGIVTVRPLRKRRVYVSTLAEIAAWVVRSTIAAEVRAAKAEKRARRGRS